MRRVLITGANSYIGTSVENWLKSGHDEYLAAGRSVRKTSDLTCEAYEVVTADTRDGNWKNTDFTAFDTVFHVAGIAHADVSHASEEEKKKYYEVNCFLASDVARHAKKCGVKQFIFMSSIIVYGESAPVGKKLVIGPQTEPKPLNFYGDSKLMAEKELQKLQSDDFHIAIIRPPMIYGEGCKGNYPVLASLSLKLCCLPRIENERSMLYIRNLCEFVRLLIDSGEGGFFYPQNEETVNTVILMQLIAKANGKTRKTTVLLKPFVRLAAMMPGRIGKLCNKAFGNMTYEKDMSCHFNGAYRLYGLEESVELSRLVKQ